MVNCKPGDMAIIIKSQAGNEGKIVTCIRFVGNYLPKLDIIINTDYWLIDTPIRCIGLDGKPSTQFTPYARDACLKPLRPDDKVDEFLMITGLPPTENEYEKILRRVKDLERVKKRNSNKENT